MFRTHSSTISVTLYVRPPAPDNNGTTMQVFHVCWGKRRAAFMCPEGTLFNQLVQVCDWWYNVDCDDTVASGKNSQSARDT